MCDGRRKRLEMEFKILFKIKFKIIKPYVLPALKISPKPYKPTLFVVSSDD